jgi:hypothetical protein
VKITRFWFDVAKWLMGGDENAVGFSMSCFQASLDEVFSEVTENSRSPHFPQISQLFQQIFSVSRFLFDTSPEHYN